MIASTVDLQWRGDEVKIRGKAFTGATAFELGLVVQGEAKLLSPVNYGYLRASITTQAYNKGTEPESPSAGRMIGPDPGPPPVMKIDKPSDPNEVLVGTPVEYASNIEFGTIRSNAQPFLRPALKLAKGQELVIVKREAKYHFQEYLLEHDEYLRSRGK